MIEHGLDIANSVLHVRPRSSLEERDFAELARTIDPRIEEAGGLAGLAIELDAARQWVISWWAQPLADLGAFDERSRQGNRCGHPRTS